MRSGSHHIKHLLGQVIGHHFLDQRRHIEAHMTGTATEIQQSRTALPGQFCLQQREFGALGVHGTAQVGRRLFAELFLHDLGVGGVGHGGILQGLRC